MINPFPDIISNRVWSLLFAWAEWRSGLSHPKSVRFPEVTYKWRLGRGSWIGEPGFCLARSTAPKSPGILDEFGQAFWDLEWDRRAYLFALIDRQGEPWLRGERWQEWFQEHRITRRNYLRLLKDALKTLQMKARKRGLTRWSP